VPEQPDLCKEDEEAQLRSLFELFRGLAQIVPKGTIKVLPGDVLASFSGRVGSALRVHPVPEPLDLGLVDCINFCSLSSDVHAK